MTNLSDFTIFLHGPSGAGKGELQRKLGDFYTNRGYTIHHISSGEIFREAMTIPAIAQTMKSGTFFETLDVVKPVLQKKYREFVQEWSNSNGKAILILDGLVRRGEFISQEGPLKGQLVPSQIQQDAQAFMEVRNEFPDLQIENLDAAILEVKNSKHLLIDINPQDAELQMRLRANKELTSIQNQVEARIAEDLIPFEATAQMLLLMKRLFGVINADIKTEDEFNEISKSVQTVRDEIAAELGIKGTSSFAAFFKNLGITTELRDDDISPLARRKRIESYVKTETDSEGKALYEPGFAAQALIEGLGYRFSRTGSFSSNAENHLVVQNGKSKGIELQTFQAQCEGVGSRLARITDETRHELFRSGEGHRRRKED